MHASASSLSLRRLCTSGWILALLILLPLRCSTATEVFSQPFNGTGTIHRSCFMDPDGSNWDEFAWDSFQLASAEAITEIHWRGGFSPAYNHSGGPVQEFEVALVANNLSLWEPDVVHPPLVRWFSGDNCGQTLVGTFGGTQLYDYHFTLPSPFQAAANTRYWIHITAYQNGVPDWGFAAASGGNGSHFRKQSEYMYQSVPGDFAFSLFTSAAPTALIVADVNPVNGGSVFGDGVYPLNASALLSATPASGFGFDRWTEAGSTVSHSANYMFTVTGDRDLVANFLPAWQVNTVSWPSMGGTTSGAGLYNAGASVTVEATPVPGYEFVQWLQWGSPASSTPVWTFQATAHVELEARFAQLPATATFDFDTGTPACFPSQIMPASQSHSGLTAFLSPWSGSWSIQNSFLGWVPSVFDGNFLYPSSFNCTLLIQFSQPLTDLGLCFMSGEVSSEFDTASLLRMTAYMDSPASPALASVSGRGDWMSGAYPEGRLELASAQPFNTVIVDVPSGQPYPVSNWFFLDNLIAQRWQAPPVMLTVTVIPAGAGTVEGAGVYSAGDTASLLASAAQGFIFSSWKEAGLEMGRQSALDLLMDGDRQLQAVFAPVLGISRDPLADPGLLDLGWAWPAEGFVLQQRSDSPPFAWSDVLLPVEVVNGRNRVQVPEELGVHVYRLAYVQAP